MASTDTHNAIPGGVDEETFVGHGGDTDDEVTEKLG